MPAGLEKVAQWNDENVNFETISKHMWLQTYKTPCHVHEIWMDVVRRKEMVEWSIYHDANEYFIVGKVSLHAMTDGKNENAQNAWTAIYCRNDVAPLDLRRIGHVRESLMHVGGQLPIRNMFLSIATQSPCSVHYYTLHDCLAI